MVSKYFMPRAILMALGLGSILAGSADPQERTSPRPEPVAETRLLMQAMNMPNFKGLETLLQKEPVDTEAWTFARGQALLIAENGNLLMLRPPRNQGREAWLDRAAELRKAATRVARAAANRDYAASRAGLGELASACNHCHQSFRVTVRLGTAEQQPEQPKTPSPSSPPVP